MGERLWIVEAEMTDKEWKICDFGKGSGQRCAHTDFLEAHKAKRAFQKWLYLNGSIRWTSKCFRVREYISK